MELKAFRGTVRGRVQGVWFRASMKRAARRWLVNGWVRNLSDGGVEFEVHGEPRAVEALLEWVWSGPPAARVDKVELLVIEVDEGRRSFDVLR